MMKLTEHFTIEELTFSDYAIRHGIDNTPTEGSKENLLLLAKLLEEVRSLLGNMPLRILSGYRNNAVNTGIGGVDNSQHRFGCAADCTHKYLSVEECCKQIIASNIQFDQVINEYDSWFHISIPDKEIHRARRQPLRKDQEGYKPF